MSEADESIDARGLNCPLPVLKAQKRLKSMNQGSTLEVLADDPKALADFEQFAQAGGHELAVAELDGNLLRVVIVKGVGIQKL